MISWMQKHNKYLVWTIWVATIAFIGAGFVGWGTLDLSGKSGNVAKVGDIEISQTKLNMVYSNIYSQYNEAMQGKLDDKKAKEMGLVKQAFKRLETQAKILNFAKEVGIIVSDEEILERIQAIAGFKKEGVFNQDIYNNYLLGQRIKAKVFENTFREELIIQKTIALLTTEGLDLEIESISAAMNVSDKLAYIVLSEKDVDFTLDEAKAKSFWEMQKENYMTKQKYDLSIVWTESKTAVVTEDEIKAYYEANSFNYTNAQGKQLSYEEAKSNATNDLKLKKTKKSAQKAYIAFKKGTLNSSEKITLSLGDLKLTPDVWNALQEKSIGDILKPKVVADMYATIKIENIVLPKVKTYAEAKAEVTTLYTAQAKKEALLILSEKTLKEFNQSKPILSNFVKLEENIDLKPLNNQESVTFLQKLFTSSKEKGIISVMDKIVVYNILEQKLTSADKNETKNIQETVNTLKQNTFETNLIKMLDKKYPTETYVTGL